MLFVAPELATNLSKLRQLVLHLVCLDTFFITKAPERNIAAAEELFRVTAWSLSCTSLFEYGLMSLVLPDPTNHLTELLDLLFAVAK